MGQLNAKLLVRNHPKWGQTYPLFRPMQTKITYVRIYIHYTWSYRRHIVQTIHARFAVCNKDVLEIARTKGHRNSATHPCYFISRLIGRPFFHCGFNGTTGEGNGTTKILETNASSSYSMVHKNATVFTRFFLSFCVDETEKSVDSAE